MRKALLLLALFLVIGCTAETKDRTGIMKDAYDIAKKAVQWEKPDIFRVEGVYPLTWQFALVSNNRSEVVVVFVENGSAQIKGTTNISIKKNDSFSIEDAIDIPEIMGIAKKNGLGDYLKRNNGTVSIAIQKDVTGLYNSSYRFLRINVYIGSAFDKNFFVDMSGKGIVYNIIQDGQIQKRAMKNPMTMKEAIQKINITANLSWAYARTENGRSDKWDFVFTNGRYIQAQTLPFEERPVIAGEADNINLFKPKGLFPDRLNDSDEIERIAQKELGSTDGVVSITFEYFSNEPRWHVTYLKENYNIVLALNLSVVEKNKK